MSTTPNCKTTDQEKEQVAADGLRVVRKKDGSVCVYGPDGSEIALEEEEEEHDKNGNDDDYDDEHLNYESDQSDQSLKDAQLTSRYNALRSRAYEALRGLSENLKIGSKSKEEQSNIRSRKRSSQECY